MRELVRNRARELGFDACRITTAQAPEFAPKFERWLAAGYNGEMAYLRNNAEKRTDPQRVLPGARSLIALAVSYYDTSPPGSAPKPSGEASPANGLIARYARHQDYHKVLAPRLKEFAVYVNELGGDGTRSLWYVDSGPLLERELAQRAGLGFIGKHTNLISRTLGNWFLLAEILTTLELEPEASERNHCGSCARCLSACPTGAITAPFQLDARLCISYLTIELKGPIPTPLRRAIGNRIFGCDDCLEVCPWNRFARQGQIMREQARPDLATPDLLELLALDEEGFRRRFAGTPMLRAKRRGLLRNVCVALGNVGDATALPGLERAARSEDSLVAEHARWARAEILAKSGRKEQPLPEVKQPEG